MRTVFRNHHECAHVWASGRQSVGSANHVFFYDSIIYSYGTHFKIAKHYALGNERICLYTDQSYSVSTEKHKGIVRGAWYGNGELVICHPKLWPEGETITQAQVDAIKAEAATLIADDNQRKAERKRERARELRERSKLRKMNVEQRLAHWKNGGNVELPYGTPIQLRYIDGGKRIETSQRATVPTVCAAKAWKAFQDGKLAIGDTIGHFTVDAVGTETVKIGCHLLPVATLTAFFADLT
jgi:hypothetical protein